MGREQRRNHGGHRDHDWRDGEREGIGRVDAEQQPFEQMHEHSRRCEADRDSRARQTRHRAEHVGEHVPPRWRRAPSLRQSPACGMSRNTKAGHTRQARPARAQRIRRTRTPWPQTAGCPAPETRSDPSTPTSVTATLLSSCRTRWRESTAQRGGLPCRTNHEIAERRVGLQM